MADRRMFSKRITSSARFLKMPVSTQCLYFHLGLHADDDGVVEAYTIMNLVGATEDDLKILVAKEFVVVLNEDLVTYITDWKENNKIRADRKIDSLYKDLLIQMLPDVKLLEKKPRADRQKENNGTSQGQPEDNQGTDNGLHRLGQARLGKDRLGQVSLGKVSIETAEDNTNKTVNNVDNLEQFDADAVYILNYYLPNLSTQDKKRVLSALKDSGNDFYYLEEKIKVLQQRENINSQAGFLVKAIKDDYKLRGAC